MRKVLVTNHFLKDFTGSEIATLDLTKEFLSRGYDVTVGSFTFADPLKSKFDLLDVKMIDLSSAKAEHFDLIWAHHFTTLDTCLIDIGITADKIIFSSLSPYEALESPPISIEKVNLFLANSLETKHVLTKMGINAEHIMLFPNPVSDDFFIANSEYKNQLKKIAVVSNHIPKEVKEAINLLESHGIEVKIFGIEGEFKLVTPELLLGFDAIITIGRTVQYCLALSIPIYCYDRFGGPGWITQSNIELASQFNFSGRCVNHFKTSNEIVSEIFKGFIDLGKDIVLNKNYARTHYSLSNLVDLINNKMVVLDDTILSNQQLVFKSIVFRQRKYWSLQNGAKLFIQLFLDHGNGISEENSIKLSVAQNTDIQEFVFDLSDKPSLTALRLDPLNDSCVIEIEKCTMMTDHGEIDLREHIASNALIHHGNTYFFDHNDPQIYFNDLYLDKLDAENLIARIRFVHIGNDTLKACINQIIIDKNYVIASKESVLEHTRIELDQTKRELDQTKTELTNICTSRCYKLTRPLRKIKQLFKGN